LQALEETEISYFSPKDEVLVNTNSTEEEQKKAFNADIGFIFNCDFVIVNTAGKDLGTIFEAGFSYAYKKPIIYYFKAPDGVNFNLMLAHSGTAVAKNKQQLIDILNQLKNNEFDFSKLAKYKGNIE
jgi:nucleoside 2-deoxyribosyltransferase